ncbi:hypothetical protein [Cellulomonas gelida]|uniref:Integral membrane protein n=1 Tax=Cellulomonas gelida TaxID=1712 RepID=A0A4Y3KKT9_9CELL|nr:hypothetical protein [Cellulomonas gelida]GEA83550.1 hypothetical protein CGE01nite_08010 [Cellulomonas gelida]GGL24061.1 hypothetical protein GCM10009774_13180 [Cellulomonas gelida]
MSASSPSSPAAGRPAALVVVCLLTLLEAATAAGLAVAWAVDLVRGVSVRPAASVFLIVFGLAIAFVLAAGARGLWRGRRWARSPVMTWQIMLVVLSIGWLGVESSVWAWGVLLAAVVVGVGLLLPAVVAVTTGAASRADASGASGTPSGTPKRR